MLGVILTINYVIQYFYQYEIKPESLSKNNYKTPSLIEPGFFYTYHVLLSLTFISHVSKGQYF